MTKKLIFLLTASVLSLGIMTGCSGGAGTAGGAQSDDSNVVSQADSQNISSDNADDIVGDTAAGNTIASKITEDMGGNTTAAADTGSYISEEEASAIALAEVAGATEDDLRIHRDSDDGRNIYEGSILYDGVEYDFEIDAQSGQIIDWGSEMEDDHWIDDGGNTISEDEASSIALAEVDGAKKKHLRIHKDTDDGRNIYEGSILYDGVEYDFEIDAQSGQIIDWSSEMEDDNWTNTPNSNGSIITEQEAKNIALGEVNGATDQNIRIHLETDDGRQIYEGEILYNETEYEFEIDAQSGQIIDWGSESIYD